jgi:superfamily II DNA or RNA helicase
MIIIPMIDSEIFELLCIKKHTTDKHDENVYHWKDIPEEIINESGWLGDNPRARRMKKLKNPRGKNPYTEFGLDGMSINKEEVDKFTALQFKYYDKKTLDENCLGTFLMAYNAMRRKKPKSRGHIYYTGKSVKGLRARCFEENITVSKVRVEPDDMKEAIPKEIVLRDYQNEIVNKIVSRKWKGGGLVDLPCGLGKTVIASSSISKSKCLTTVIFCPLIEQCRQFAKSLKVECRLVNSENIRCGDLIREAVNYTKQGTKIALVTTFDSFDVIKEVFKDNPPFVIVDEVHKIRDDLSDWLERSEKWIGLSGTPLDDQRESMETLGKMAMDEAIERKLVCDYEVIMPLVEEVHGDNTEWSKKAEFLMSASLRFACRKIIVYCRSVEECKTFREYVMNYALTFHNEEVWSEIVVGDANFCTPKQRRERLRNFAMCTNRFALLFSVHILNESIDIPECDSIYLPQPAVTFNESSHTLIVQRSMRANRLNKHAPHKKAKILIFAGEDHDVFSMFSRLKEDDVNFAKKVRRVTCNYDKSVSFKEREVEATELVRSNVRAVSADEMWLRNLEKFKEFVEKKGRLPTRKEKYRDWNIGRWMDNQKRNRGKNPERDKLLEEVKGWKWAEKVKDERTWEEQYQDFKKFVKEKGRLPTAKEKYGDWNIGSWMDWQKRNRGKNPERDKLLEDIEGWKWAENWEEQYQDFKEFVEEKGRLPTSREKYGDWNIGSWMDRQKKNRGKNLERDKLLEDIEGWKWAEKKDERTWEEQYQDFKEFVEEKGRLPIQKEKYGDWNIGKWMHTQKVNRGKNTERDKLLEEIEGWKWAESVRMKDERTWEEQCQDFKEFVEEKGRLPTRSDKYRGWNIGKWMDRQKGNRGKNLERDKLLEDIEGWKWRN